MVHLDQPLHLHSSHYSLSQSKSQLDAKAGLLILPQIMLMVQTHRTENEVTNVSLEKESVPGLRGTESQYFHEDNTFLLGQRHYEHSCFLGVDRASKTVFYDICRAGCEVLFPPLPHLFSREIPDWFVLTPCFVSAIYILPCSRMNRRAENEKGMKKRKKKKKDPKCNQEVVRSA